MENLRNVYIKWFNTFTLSYFLFQSLSLTMLAAMLVAVDELLLITEISLAGNVYFLRGKGVLWRELQNQNGAGDRSKQEILALWALILWAWKRSVLWLRLRPIYQLLCEVRTLTLEHWHGILARLRLGQKVYPAPLCMGCHFTQDRVHAREGDCTWIEDLTLGAMHHPIISTSK